MPGAGTDKTRDWIAAPGPVVVLVEPQLGENIGAAARAMANFGLSRLRLVTPRQPWPNAKARMMAAGADRVLDAAALYDSLPAATADCSFVFAATARAHDQAKPVVGAAEAAASMAPRVSRRRNRRRCLRPRAQRPRERRGRARRPHPHAAGQSGLCLAQFGASGRDRRLRMVQIRKRRHTAIRHAGKIRTGAERAAARVFLRRSSASWKRSSFFGRPDKRETMQINLRNIFTRMQPTQQDIQTLHGVIMAIAEGRKGPARGGVLDGEEAAMLRTLLAEHGGGRVPSERGPVRGLARLLRRNPTEAERALWQALVNDRRFAGRGFKRQTPIGPHICDFVSFPLRLVIDLVPAEESAAAAKTRAERHAWLAERGYRVIEMTLRDVEINAGALLDRLEQAIAKE